MQTSLYDRSRHLEMIRSMLGEDLWFLKDGVTPRTRMNDQHVVRMITDGSHPLADRAMHNLFRLMPIRYREQELPMREWACDYAVVKPDSVTTGYRKEFPDYLAHMPTRAQRRAAPLGRSNLLNHVFLEESILPSYRFESSFDSLLIDIDVQIGGEKLYLHDLDGDDLLEIIAPAVSACTELSIEPLVMLSGGRGFWLQMFWDEPVSRDVAESLFSSIMMSGGFVPPHVDEGHWTMEIGDVFYRVDAGNLSSQVCRMPWSMKEGFDNDRVSVHVDLETGLPRPDFMVVELPISSISEVVAVIPPRPPSHDHCGDVCPRDGSEEPPMESILWDAKENSPAVAVIPPPPPSHDHCGDVCRAPRHLDWDWSDVEAEARGESAIPTLRGWRELIEVCEDGEKRERLVGGGNIALVSARMKHELGYVDWNLLKAGYAEVYRDSDQTRGGTISEWIDDWNSKSSGGATITPCPPGLTIEDLERYREFVENLRREAGRTRMPDVEDMYRVLIVMARLTISGEREISTDFLARKAGINPYRTWEDQMEAEGIVANAGDRERHVRHNPTSDRARKRLSRILHLLCDMDLDGGWKPFRRLDVGTNSFADPRVAKAGKSVGSRFSRNVGHELWRLRTAEEMVA